MFCLPEKVLGQYPSTEIHIVTEVMVVNILHSGLFTHVIRDLESVLSHIYNYYIV